MHARVTTTSIGEEHASIAEIFEHVTPALRQLEGYRGVFVLTDAESSEFVVVSLWETAEAMEASEPIAARIKTAETANRDFEIESTKHYRVDSFDLAR
jgi:heme-degrading monooxygenase HmoA